MKIPFTLFCLWLLLSLAFVPAAYTEESTHAVQPGDTWTALSYQYRVPAETLQAANHRLNRQQEPAIGSMVIIPGAADVQMGTLTRPLGTLLATAVRFHLSPWQLARQNGLPSPYHPVLYRPLFIRGGGTPPRDLPPEFATLEVSQQPAHPGQALGIRALVTADGGVTATLAGNEMDGFADGRHFLALTGTGAFFGSGLAELAIRVEGRPLWTQPWLFVDPDLWQYQQITLTGAAAEIDQASIEAERERLMAIWGQNTPRPQWSAPFQLPITNYLEISSPFGARRSYNGGPYRTYHEGVDFSAYGGSPVYAAAAGSVVVAEQLYVRGGAVIIDHGLGVYTGYYHLSQVLVAPGDAVESGQPIGAVGTSGLSTGNHLHWDLLVDGIWVDAQAWLDQDVPCWILAGMGNQCPAPPEGYGVSISSGS